MLTQEIKPMGLKILPNAAIVAGTQHSTSMVIIEKHIWNIVTKIY